MKKVLKEILNPYEQPRKRFGELMVESHYLSEEELQELLDQQKAHPERRLGYLCLEKGYADPLEVMDVLTRQLPVVVDINGR